MKWIAVVDNDESSLRLAEQVLTGQHMRVVGLPSGEALMEHLKEHRPDLILLDERLPDMDGYAVLQKLKEDRPDWEEIPVVLLTEDGNPEFQTRRLQMGAMDSIRKPFTAEQLVNRVKTVLNIQERIHRFEIDATTDALTGFLNKAASDVKMAELCRTDSGFLCVLDLDNFKLVNDLRGHDMGDQVLSMFSRVLKRCMRFDGVCGRIGGDEFILFARSVSSEDELHQFVDELNRLFAGECEKLLGPQHQIPLGVSVGAALVPEQGRDFARLFHIADQALYTVKQNGKRSLGLWGRRETDDRDMSEPTMDLAKITSVLEERYITPNAMWMGKEAFGNIYRYMVRYMQRYHSTAYRVLFTVKVEDTLGEIERAEVMAQFRKQMQRSLRNSDVMMETSDHQLFLLLPEAHEYDIEHVINRLLAAWHGTEFSRLCDVTYEAGRVHLANDDGEE